MSKAKFSFIEFIKTAAIYVLVFSMLSFAGIYMNERQNAGQPSEVPWEKRRVFENGGIIPSAIQINPNHVNPLQITVTSDSKSVTAVYDSKLVYEIYKDFKNIIRIMFDGTAVCDRIGDEDTAKELWDRSLEAPDSVYIRYAGDYVYPVIHAFTVQNDGSEEYGFAGNKIIAKVHEMFIIPSEESGSKFCGIARDTDGNVSIFYPDEIYGDFIDSVNFAAYNDIAGVISCKFLKNGEINKETGFNKNRIKNLELPGDFQLFDDFTYSSVLNYRNPIFDEYNEIDKRESGVIKDLLKVFNFNIESSGLHSVEENGISGKKFIENHGSLSIFEDGQIFYYSTSIDSGGIGNINPDNDSINGIHLSSFLGYDSAYYTFYEKIGAASILINTMNTEIAGSDSDLYLTDVKFEDERLTVKFSYYYKGIKIRADNRNLGVSIVISRNNIVEVNIDALRITAGKTVRNMKQVTALTYFGNKLSGTENTKNTEDTEDIEDTETAEDYENVEVIEVETEHNENNENNENGEEKFIIKGIELIYSINTEDIDKPVAASWFVTDYVN